MNIFFLSFDPEECARYYCDQHVLKLIIEIAQMLYCAHHVCEKNDKWKKSSPDNAYKQCFTNHPITKWCRQSKEHYSFACKLGLELCKEYTYRYNKIHKTQKHLEWLKEHSNLAFDTNLEYSQKQYVSRKILNNKLTPIPLAMPSEYNDPDPITAYRTYYKEEKLKFARYTKRKKPLIFQN